MRSALALAAVLATAAVLLPASVAQAQDPVVVRYPPSSVRIKLIAGGLAVTGAAYGVGYLCASQWPDAPGADALKIPVAGPWIALGQSGCAADDPDCGFTKYFRGFLTVLDGLMQLGGVGIIGEGIFMTTESESEAQRKAAANERGIVIRPFPVVTAHSTGVGVVGSF